MRTLNMPTDPAESQQEVLRRVRALASEGVVAHLRAVSAHIDGEWRPICGRIDIARREHAPSFPARPLGTVRLLFETVDLPELVLRLEAAFRGKPLVVSGEAVVGHGMNTPWSAWAITDDWKDYGAGWPVVSLAPMGGVARPVYLSEAIEAEGAVEAFDGTSGCVRALMGYVEQASHQRDTRFSSFQIVEWDYRGRITTKVSQGVLRVTVEPPSVSELTLAVVARDAKQVHSKKFASPALGEVPIDGELLRINATLRHRGDIVCEVLYDKSQEQALTQLGHHVARSSSAPEVEESLSSTVSLLVLGFMTDQKLATLVARDLEELDAAVGARAHKAAVLLAGSILEAALLDALGRNDTEARTRLGKKWPEKASLKDLIDTATSITVTMPDGTALPLLPPLTGKKGIVVTDHRDLIHPRAEVRGASTIDEHTVSTMKGVLGEVIRDLRQAHERGVLTEYAAGKVV